ncbi:MAG: asparagine synthase (glutamine-hydrolyzing), partial [Deltaproteobacteria bacterium]|nr:asparagine synthase (glutamine-hydrolyzing) [Deltaproteobacteria bacterium]
MCGVCGFAGPPGRNRAAADKLLEAMCRRLAHRGPDGQGALYREQGGVAVGLGHRRLSIIDLSEGGAQPMENEDGTVALSANGEIYNYKELSAGLKRRGHVFRGACDSEVLVHLYEEKGTGMLHELSGMFAFALWDGKNERLVLARDRAGIKPMYWTLAGGTLYFASEAKALLICPGVGRKVDEKALDAYLALGYIPGERTIFQGIHKLPPAGLLVFEQGAAAVSRWWKPAWTPKADLSEAEAAERLPEVLRRAVSRHLVADVPVGSFLSGGVDSTVVTALAAASAPGLSTFSLGWEGSAGDELPFARLAADFLRTDHHELLTQPASADLLPKILWHLDEPLFDNSALPAWQLCALARGRVKAVLSGDGGDELFAGYSWTLRDQLRRGFALLTGPAHGAACAALALCFARGREYDPSLLSKAVRAVGDLCGSMEEGFIRRTSVSAGFRQRLYSPALKERLGGWDAVSLRRAAFAEPRVEDGRERMLHADFSTFLPDDCLAKMDRMSMAHGLEVRVPLLDPEVVDFAVRLPYGFKVRGLTGKHVVKRAFTGRVPS